MDRGLALICAAVLALGACGDDGSGDGTTAAGSSSSSDATGVSATAPLTTGASNMTTDAGTTSTTGTDPDSTTAPPATTDDPTTDGPMCPNAPEGEYAECPGFCAGGGFCLQPGGDVVNWAVCSRGCFEDCNCWRPPEGDGDAPAVCSQILTNGGSACILDCSGGQTCPSGMSCFDGLCAFDFVPEATSSDSGGDSGTSGSTGGGSGSSTGGN